MGPIYSKRTEWIDCHEQDTRQVPFPFLVYSEHRLSSVWLCNVKLQVAMNSMGFFLFKYSMSKF